MTEEDKKKTAEAADEGAESRRLSGHFTLDLPKSKKGANEAEREQKKFRARLKGDLQKPRFWLEVFALLVVIAYTRAAYRANKLMYVANQNATRALHVSERAYITTDGPVLDPTTKFVTMNLNNVGHIPCPHSETIAHEATVNMPVANTAPELKDAVEFHWRSHKGPIPPGRNGVTLASPTAFSESKITTQGASQAIFIAGTISYQDGFADDGPQQWAFCFQSVYHLTLKKIFWVACDPAIVLPQMEKLDGYPNNEQQN